MTGRDPKERAGAILCRQWGYPRHFRPMCADTLAGQQLAALLALRDCGKAVRQTVFKPMLDRVAGWLR